MACSTPLAVALAILLVGDGPSRRIFSENEKETGILTSPTLLGLVGSDTTFGRNAMVDPQRSRAIEFLLAKYSPVEHDESLYGFLDLVWILSFNDGSEIFTGKYVQLIQRVLRALDLSSNRPWLNRFCGRVCRSTIRFILKCLPDHPGRLKHSSAIPLDAVDFAAEETTHANLYRYEATCTPSRGRKRRESSIQSFREQRRFQKTGNARRAAYNLINVLIVATNSAPTKQVDLDSQLLVCASVECETILPHVIRTLNGLAQTKSQDKKGGKHAVVSLLPAMVAVVCSPSALARHASCLWIRDFIAHDDPLAALHMLNHLRTDRNASVATAAQRTIEALPIGKGVDPLFGSATPGPIHLDRNKAIDFHALKGDLMQKIQTVSKRHNVDNDTALWLLIDGRYSESAVAKTLMQEDTERDQLQRSITPELNQLSSCEICFDDNVQGYSCPNQHKFCSACWKDYLSVGFEDSNTIVKITCPRPDCYMRLSPKFLHSVSPDFGVRWEALVFEHFLETSETHSPCPRVHCSGVVTLSSTGEKSRPVTCATCQTQYCFQCGGDTHCPASCESYRKWIHHVATTSFWVRMNSKPCPHCSAPIEKNAGCNHMHCTLCGTDFCWVCLSTLDFHLAPHACNRYQEGSSEEHRAQFFAQRFRAHKEAQTIESKRQGDFEELAFLDENDVDRIQNASVALLDAREFLANSYVAAWEMSTEHSRLELFSGAQAALETFTERLSSLTETNQAFTKAYHEGGKFNVEFTVRSLAFLAETVTQYKTRLSEICATDHVVE